MFENILTGNDSYLFLIILIIFMVVVFVLLAMIRFLIPIFSFAFPNAKFNAMGNNYVNYNELQQLSTIGTTTGALEHVSSRYYPFKSIDRIDQIEAKILKSELKLFKDVYNTVPKNLKGLVRCYLIKWECRYLKSIISEKILGRLIRSNDPEVVPEVDLNSEMLQKLRSAPTLPEMLTILSSTRYYKKLKSVLEKPSVDLVEVDRVLDEIFFTELNKLKGKLPRNIYKPASTFINLTNDVSNVKILLRAKYIDLKDTKVKQLLKPAGKQLSSWKLDDLAGVNTVQELIRGLEGTDYHDILDNKYKTFKQTGDIQVLEIALDRFYLDEIIKLSLESSLTVGPTIRFIISLEFETRNLTSVFRGIHKKVPAEKILTLTIYEQKGVET